MYKQSSYNTVNTFTRSTGRMPRLMIVVLIPLLLLFCFNTDASAAAYTVNIDDAIADEESGTIKFRVWLNQKIVAGDEGTGVSFQTFPGSAADPDDFTGVLSGTVTFDNEGDFETSISITLSDDSLIESAENFIVNLMLPVVGPGIVNPGDTTATGIINDEDLATVTLAATDNAASEPAGGNDGVFTVSLDNQSSTATVIAYKVTGDATSGNDYTALTNSVTIPANTSSAAIDVTVLDDALFERDETVTIALNSPITSGHAGISVDTTPATVTISDNDTYNAEIGSTTYNTKEKDSDFTLNIPVVLDQAVPGGATVTYTLTPGTAAAGSDYEDLSSGTLTYTAAQTTQNIQINIKGDDLVEEDESFTVSLTAGSGQTVSNTPATVTIVRDDYSAELVEGDQTVAEGGSVTYTIRMSPASGVAPGDTYAAYFQSTVGASSDFATPGDDFTAFQTKFTWVNGDPIDQSFGIITKDDTITEADKRLWADLGSTLGSYDLGYQTVWIESEDAAIVTIEDIALEEGSDGGVTNFLFTVTLDNDVQNGFNLAFSVNDGTATDADDFDVATATPLTFAGTKNETQDILVAVAKDNVSEDDETFEIVLGALSNIALSAAADITSGDTATGTIIYDDYEAFLGADITVPEGNLPADGVNLIFTVNLDRPNKSGGNIDLAVNTADDTALAGSDYTALAAHTVSIANTQQSATFNVAVIEDTVVEHDEVFLLNLSSASSNTTVQASPNDRAVGTIDNDDQATLAINDVTAAEGADGTTTTFTFTVTLTGDVDQALTVDYTTADDTATSGDGDYLASFGMLNFAGTNGETQTIDVVVNGDDVVEYNETFYVTLGNIAVDGKDVIFTDNSGTGTIFNDNKYKISVDDVSVDEPDGAGATTPATFTITLHQAVLVGQTATVGYATGNSLETPNAVAGTDYTAIGSAFVDFAAGESTKTVDVTILNEAVDVDTEYYYFIASASTNTEVDDGIGLGTIIDNEYHVLVSDGANGSISDAGDNVAERSSDFPVGGGFTVTADTGYCIDDITRNGTEVLGIHPSSPYTAYQATDIQDDPTTIAATFITQSNYTVIIEPEDAREDGAWRLKDTTTNRWLLPGTGYPTTSDPDAAWLTSGQTVIIPCDKGDFVLEFNEVSGWYPPSSESGAIIPWGAGDYTETKTYTSKTVLLTLVLNGNIGNEVIGVDPTGTGESGVGTYLYQRSANETVTLTASASTTPGAETIFLGWSGASDATTNSVELVMDSDQTITANFGTPGVDNDGDGYIAGDTAINPDWDCNDVDPTIHPNAIELCGDGIDQDCSGGDAVCEGDDKDNDGDGYTENQGDCNDNNPLIHPGATEICSDLNDAGSPGNDVDEDCYDGPRDCGTELICSDYSEQPLETQAQSAAPNVLFVLDDSGSMRWQTMTTETDGKYVLGPEEKYTSIYGNSALERIWQSQYAGYNRIWYNPGQAYVPWPRWNEMDDTEAENGTKIKNGGTPPAINADIDNPRYEPTDDGDEFDLNGDFFSVKPVAGAGADITQWVTVRRHSGSNNKGTAADAIRLINDLASPTEVIIVDNSDGSDYYDESGGNWQDSGTPQMYLGNARFNKKNDRLATWYFEITAAQAAAGPYYVQAWWSDWDKWDEFAKYNITYNGGVTTPDIVKDQGINGGQWITLGGPYPFIEQAIASSSSLLVKNAHYFIWVDHDGNEAMLYEQNDGATFTNSEVYLVNLPGSGGTYEMQFYRFVDNDEDGKVDDDELQKVANTDDHWDDIQPKNEDGTVRTAAEERQNFANWYSFYRRREFTAKAAIGRTVTGTSGMNIGILGINGRIQEELVPIGVAGDRVKVVDNSDAGFSSSGAWNTWSTSTAVNGNSRWSNSNGDTARFTPNFSAEEAGNYDVYAWWPCWTGWDSTTKYTIVDGDGTAVVTRDQRQGGSEGCGLWVPLGNYDFDAGSGYVQVESTGDYVAADAIKFISTGDKVNVNETDYLLNKLYQVSSSGNTPLRRGLQNAGKYFDNEDSGASGGLSATAPWASAVDGGGCQRAFAILMTDGYYNGYDPSPSVGNEDSDGDKADETNANGKVVTSQWDSGIFAGPEGQTLADVAMYYYEKDLHKGLADDVPAHNYDTADHQHMVTYGVSFGVYGTLDPADYPNCLPDTAPQETAATCPAWPKPDSDEEKIDDLYHASVNGRGKYLNAASPGELVTSLKKIIDAVAATSGTGSSVSINAQELKEGTLLFQASYVTGSWRGDLKAKELDPDTGEVLDTLWSAAEALAGKTHATRHIVTYDGATGQQFRFNDTNKDLTPDQAEKLLNWAPGTITQADFSDMGAADITKLRKLVEYLRGDATNEGTASGTYRQRPEKDGVTDIGPLGDIVHSAPQHVAGVVYVGGNDGMLHAFDDTTGEELFAYVPNLIYDDLDELASQTYSHNYYVDNSPYSLVVPDGTDSVRLLTGTLGRGGKGVYALDISDVGSGSPATEADAKGIVKWEYPNNIQPTSSPGTDDDLGYGFGRAFIANSKLGYVVIMGNGYQSLNGKAMLYVLDALTGTLLGKIDTGAGSPTECNGLSVPVLIDPDFDGIADYAYAGDLLGNMWKFDLRGNSISDWKVAYADSATGDPRPLFQAKNKIGHRQPITTKPDVIAHPDSSLGGYMVVFGTGRYLGTADFGDNSVQSVYGIWDWAAAWEKAGGTSADKYLGAFGPVTGDPEFGRLSYFNKPAGQDFVVGDTVTGATSDATGVIEEIVEDSVRLNYSDKLASEDFVVGDTVTGSTSNATGVIESITEADDTTGYLILKNLSKTNFFEAGEPITSATVSQDAVAGQVVGNTAGSLKLKGLSLTDTFVAGELITSSTVTTGAVAASDMLPIAFRPLANLVGNAVGEYVTLLEQNQIAFIGESRFMSNNTPYWFKPGSTSSGKLEHVGWYFDLPGANEKMIRDVLIRNGIAFMISSVPSSSPCASGGSSIIHALDATSGGRSLTAVFDISGPDGMPDGKIDEHDLVNIGTPSNPHYVAPTGLSRDAMWYTPAVLAVADSDTDVMYFSTSKGDVKLEKVEAEKVGVFFWREID